MYFVTYNGSSFDERMRITHDGYVGIGSSAPVNPLEIITNTRNNTLFAWNQNTSGSNYAGQFFVTGGGVASYALYATTNGATSYNFNLYLENLSAATNNYSIYSAAVAKSYFAGSVGIGTTSPTAKLQVSTSSASNQTAIGATASSSSGQTYAGIFNALGSGSINCGLQSTVANSATYNYNLYLSSLSTGTNNYSIFSDAAAKSYFAGSVGIGAPNPSTKLYVNGTSGFFGDMSVTGHVGVNTAPNASFDIIINGSALSMFGSWISDQQFKTNIDTLQNAIATIKQLEPKTYYMDTANIYGFKFNGAKQYGIVAQELEQILPELVQTATKAADIDTLGNIVHPAVTFKSVNYIELIPFLIKAVKEQQKTIENLTTKTDVQDTVILSLQNYLNNLSAVISDCCNKPLVVATNNQQNRSASINETQTTKIDVALSDMQVVVLEQNVPNPFAEQTVIGYALPDNYRKAQIFFYNSQGKLIQTVELVNKGKGALNVFAQDLSNGTYTYTLVVDGQVIGTKKMMKQ